MVYVDFSAMSMVIAKKKAVLRRLANILWINDWIESIPYLGMGNFDLIICTGVLHHMKNPGRGLRKLNEIQKENGGAIIMLYGKYGRAGIYHMQELMRLVNKHETFLPIEVSNTKRILNVIPIDAPFLQDTGDDRTTMGEIGIYDIFLNKRDICFTIAYLYEFVENNGYNFVSFDNPTERIHINLHARLITKFGIQKTDVNKRQAIAELLISNIKLHSFYVSKRKGSKAVFINPTMNIMLNGLPSGLLDVIDDSDNYRNIGNETFIFSNLEKRFFADGNAKRGQIGRFYDHLAIFCWPFTDIGNFLLTSLANETSSKTTSNILIKRYQDKHQSKYAYKYTKKSFETLYWYFELSGMLMLRSKSISSYPKSVNSRVRLSLASKTANSIFE